MTKKLNIVDVEVKAGTRIVIFAIRKKELLPVVYTVESKHINCAGDCFIFKCVQLRIVIQMHVCGEE